MKKHIAAAVAAILLALPVQAAESVKIGFVTTLSGPAGIIGKHMKDSADLALSMLGGKIGGLPAQIVYGDDQFKPDVGRQVADEMLKRDKVDFMTGFIWSNVLLASYQPIIQSGTILISVVPRGPPPTSANEFVATAEPRVAVATSSMPPANRSCYQDCRR